MLKLIKHRNHPQKIEDPEVITHVYKIMAPQHNNQFSFPLYSSNRFTTIAKFKNRIKAERPRKQDI